MVIGMEEFLKGDPTQVFSRMRPDQRTAIAGEFNRALVVAQDPAAQQFEDEWSRDNPSLPRTLSVAQVCAIYLYTREHHAELVEQVAHHPVTQAVLANAGAPGAATETAAAAEAATEAEQARAEQINAAGAPARSAPDLLASAAETEATPMPEAAPRAPEAEVINTGLTPEPAPSPTPLPEQVTSAELAADELRAHDALNEEIGGDNPGVHI